MNEPLPRQATPDALAANAEKAEEIAQATTNSTAGIDTLAGLEEWSGLDYINEGVFGSIDGRMRSTSGSTCRTGGRVGAGNGMRSANNSDVSSTAVATSTDLWRYRGGSAPYIQTDFAHEDSAIARLRNCSESSEPDKVHECLSEVSALLDRHAYIHEGVLGGEDIVHPLSQHLPRLLSHAKGYIRSRTYKLLRRLPSPQPLTYCWQYLQLCVMHSLARDDDAHEEREQGLKFIRWTMRFDEEHWLLDPPVLKALMAVSEQTDDKMRSICLETLCEVLARVPERLWYVNGIRTLTQAALDGPWSVSVSIACTLALLFDRPETRKLIHPDITLGGVTSALTEPVGNNQMLAERAKVAAFMLTQFLKSWGGIQYFLTDERRAIRAIVEALSMADSNGKIILGMLLELFGLSDDFDTVQFEQQPRFDVELLSPFHLPPYAITQGAAQSRLLPVDFLRTLLLMIFVDEGLVEALVIVALDSAQPDVVDASATLLKWLPQHPHLPLPEKYVSRFQRLDLLVNRAMSNSSEQARNAKRIISKIECIPSISMGRLPSQQIDAWATCLASSPYYRQFLRQRRLRADVEARNMRSRPRRGSQPTGSNNLIDSATSPEATSALSSLLNASGLMPKGSSTASFGSASVVSGSKGLAAGLKDNAARVLRSSASTGNLKSAAAAQTSTGLPNGSISGAAGGVSSGLNGSISILSPVDEGSGLSKGGTDSLIADLSNVTGYRGRRSLDITRNTFHQQQAQPPPPPPPLLPQILRGIVTQSSTKSVFAHSNGSSAMGSPYVHVDNPMLSLTPSASSGGPASTATGAPGTQNDSTGTPLHIPFINTSHANGPSKGTNTNNSSSANVNGNSEAATGSGSTLALNANHNVNGNASALGSITGGGVPNTGLVTPLSAAPGATPPLLTRTRTKSRSRSRNSIVVLNNGSNEESLLSSLIQDSRVTTDDNPMRWDWDAVRAIILGHMSQAKRLPEEVKASGFLSRLSRFFHPASLEFCDLSRTTANEEYLEIGRQLIRILISTADGLLLIDESGLLLGVVDEVRKQNAYARKMCRDESCFSFARLQMTMSPGYFHFLAEIGRSVGGDSLLERNRLFDACYQVVDLSDQVLLVQYILSSMNYCAPDGHARNILRKVASSPHEPLRLLVPGFLLYLASDAPCRAGSVSAWAIEVLLGLLYDSSPGVRSAAAQCLVLAIDLADENPYLDLSECNTRINHLLDLKPMFDLAVITDIRPLVLRVIGTERGFSYLKDQGVVDSEMEAWGALEGIFHVQSIELDISRAVAFGPLFSSTPDGAMAMTTSSQTPPTPPHLFGELAKCAGGREFMFAFGIPRLLFETLDNIPWDASLPADANGLKATLWAIGAIGASRDGYLMLEPYNVIGKITQVARQASSLTIRGTCLYALALLSRSSFAAEAFQEKGWLLSSSCHGVYEFAVPKRLESLLDAGGWAHGGVLDNMYVFSEGSLHEPDVTEELDSVQKEIIESVILMSNHFMINTASKTLMRLSMSHPHYFRLLPLYCKAMHLVGKYRYRLSTRRFIYDVFDVNLASLHAEMLEASAVSATDVYPARCNEENLAEAGQGRARRSFDYGAPSSRLSSSISTPLCASGTDDDAYAAPDGISRTDSQRKRASTLQEYSVSASMSVFPRRPTNGMLLDSIRPSTNNAKSPFAIPR
ncbi:hypothetical protein IW140_004554 [Coemansia sp. RSA 1813]|nr:hypothetical protein EV178_004619 [Coemansia sp. RSA 1646]KAJ1766452.1 hypothetical protein LPJ74_005879 [Coemansia sp. RSA 1843]KAJ2088009.1 hypothetical protein IW138_004517 [Coemansia sp. RSA 986]KAJ2212648.1 hypothetical protein EV179_004474 [Coemansia sp. RSA 487]KAJ2567341.1 hypothetical protein IW140_004554 [Coemansia sp. RSA 1813]